MDGGGGAWDLGLAAHGHSRAQLLGALAGACAMPRELLALAADYAHLSLTVLQHAVAAMPPEVFRAQHMAWTGGRLVVVAPPVRLSQECRPWWVDANAPGAEWARAPGFRCAIGPMQPRTPVGSDDPVRPCTPADSDGRHVWVCVTGSRRILSVELDTGATAAVCEASAPTVEIVETTVAPSRQAFYALARTDGGWYAILRFDGAGGGWTQSLSVPLGWKSGIRTVVCSWPEARVDDGSGLFVWMDGSVGELVETKEMGWTLRGMSPDGAAAAHRMALGARVVVRGDYRGEVSVRMRDVEIGRGGGGLVAAGRVWLGVAQAVCTLAVVAVVQDDEDVPRLVWSPRARWWDSAAVVVADGAERVALVSPTEGVRVLRATRTA